MRVDKAALADHPATEAQPAPAGVVPALPGTAEVSSPAAPDTGSLAGDLLELSKMRVNLLALVTVFAGFALGLRTSTGGSLASLLSSQNGWLLLHVLVGSFVLAAAASILNQYMERAPDALMERTAARPLAAGRFSAALARTLGILFSLLGLAYLFVLVNPVCAAVSAVTAGVYVFFYTPLKRVTSFSLLVGAFAGALPPVIGLTAATGELLPAGWSIFTIQFIWQIPHFLAIAWIYREDYARAGFPMLTVVDREGKATALQVVGWSLALVPASLMPAAVFGFAAGFYFWMALGTSVLFLAFAVSFAIKRTNERARRLVIASVIYLPALFIALVLGA